MNRTDLLIRMLDTTFDKESWYAPFKPAIEGLTAEQAMWKPVGEASKSIWENVNHLVYYKERLTANLEGREWTQNLDGNETFYLTEQLNEDKEWKALVERAEMVQRRLREAISKTTTEVLEQNSLEEKLLDIMLHDAYHTGQIIQLRKMQGSWPLHR
ncbi:DinB family protein [Rossellomorea aquimaris]|uniref:DinB family protein n=1 Tax=Rossellomorea aquimaris TaxID=189382 RepID=A0A5D4TT10_9BACI|nr:DinB family protein [Rossellomorea aquimaris]TYS77941.1 DinB family protein [Rossellomorea aquimaris]TYS87123.1 DinB family protein [Rossellomorea aquimaris]